MNETSPELSLSEFNAQAQQMWDQKAQFWDEVMGEGNAFQRELILPTLRRLLDLQPGAEVLEVGCGNGVVSRALAARGARVLATDFSAALLERARARSTEQALVEYAPVDATDQAQLMALGAGRFDAAVCVMALQDIADIEPLFRSLPQLLKPGGRFLFAVPHPAFNIPQASTKLLEEEDRAGVLAEVRSVKIWGYLRVAPALSVGMAGEPAPHWFFHRPLGALLQPALQAGFLLDALEEPAFDEGSGASRPLSWRYYTELPPVLICRLRLPGAPEGIPFPQR